jgi:hypothetical protein
MLNTFSKVTLSVLGFILSHEAIRYFENSRDSATAKTVSPIRHAFRKSGVKFHMRGRRIGVTIVLPRQRR